MYNIIIIDTNIYRQLGTMFYDHIDYKSLDNYCYSSGGEIVITKTVLNEYLDFYQKEIIERNTTDIEKCFDKLKKLEHFKKIRKPDLTKQTKQQLDFIKRKLTHHRLQPKLDFLLNESDLLRFLIDNKQENRKDNTRDYLIWLNALAAAKVYPDYRIILISDDKIFVDNAYLQKIKQKHAVKKLEVHKSISSFLSIYGFQSDTLTNDFILKHIPVDEIQQQLLDNKDFIPSYISNFYYSANESFSLEKFEIQDVKVEEFYSHKDTEKNNVKIIAHVSVKVNMVYSPEKNTVALRKYLDSLNLEDTYKLNTFDDKGRPYFNEYILFLFRLTFSQQTQKITKVEYLDFFPDEYELQKIKQVLGT